MKKKCPICRKPIVRVRKTGPIKVNGKEICTTCALKLVSPGARTW